MSYSKRELIEVIGNDLTPRMLQWWDNEKLVVPGWDKGIRSYSAREAVEVAIINQLRRKSMPLQRIRSMLRRLRKVELTDQHYMLATGQDKGTAFFTSRDAVLSAAVAAPGPVFVLYVGEHVARFMPRPVPEEVAS